MKALVIQFALLVCVYICVSNVSLSLISDIVALDISVIGMRQTSTCSTALIIFSWDEIREG